MLRKVTHCIRYISANTRPHQLHWGDREITGRLLVMQEMQLVNVLQFVANLLLQLL